MKPMSIVNGRSTDPQMRILEQAFLKLGPGEELSYTDASILLKEAARTPHNMLAAKRAMKRVFDATGVRIVLKRGESYYRPTADEQLDYGAEVVRVGTKKIGHGSDTIMRAPDAELSDEGKRKRDAYQVAFLGIQRAIEDENKKLRATFKATPTLPQAK